MEVISNFVTLFAGILIPSFSTFKALKNKTQTNRLIWLRYWTVFGLFYSCQIFADIFLSWIPLYYLFKIIFILWLSSSKASGAQILYVYAVAPFLRENETAIEGLLTNFKKTASVIFWSFAQRIGVQWSGFIVQVIRLYIETATHNDSSHFSRLALSHNTDHNTSQQQQMEIEQSMDEEPTATGRPNIIMTNTEDELFLSDDDQDLNQQRDGRNSSPAAGEPQTESPLSPTPTTSRRGKRKEVSKVQRRTRSSTSSRRNNPSDLD